MNEYKLYQVKKVASFIDFINEIEKYGEAVAFKEANRDYTYFQFCDDVRRIASYMSCHHGSYIQIDISNSRMFAVVFFATIISGNIVVLLDDTEISEMGLPENCVKIREDVFDFVHKHEFFDDSKIPMTRVSVIAGSSGTTGHKKGVMLSQRNLLTDMVGGMELYEYERGAVYVNILPYTHLFGIVADLLGPLYSGGTICVLENKLRFFEGLRYYKPTNLNLPPILVDAIYNMLKKTKDFENTTGGKLKKILCAGARLNDAVNDEFEYYGLRAFSAYGLTECSPCVTMNRDKYFKKGSVGLPLSCCAVSIEDGEVVVEGSNVMLGYYNEYKTTENTIINNRIYTGDLGYIDDDGFLFLIGRKNNLIVFEDGTKLIPELIEKKLNQVASVMESLVEPIMLDNRTKIRITVVCEKHIYKQNIFDCLEQLDVLAKVEEVIFQEDELEKNVLGKIIRNKKE